MQLILPFQTHPFLSPHHSLYFSHPTVKTPIFLPNPPLFTLSLSPSHQTHIQKPIVSARKNKRRNGSRSLSRLLLKLMPIIASNLKVLPQPLDLVVEEICGGDGGGGGGLGIWKGFGGGGGFDGSKRKRKIKFLVLFLLYGVLVVCGLGLLFGGGDVESNVLLCGFGFGLSGIAMVQWWEKMVIFGVFFGGVLIGLGFKIEDLRKWVLKIRVCYPVTWRARKRRSGRRAF